MPVNIHGKQYVTVAERIKDAQEKIAKIETEVLQHEPIVVVKATVYLLAKGISDPDSLKVFTGISSANPTKLIEKTNPYEVAETSAVGRALGFAGYGIDEGIASADEMNKYPKDDKDPGWIRDDGKCSECGTTNKFHRPGCTNAK